MDRRTFLANGAAAAGVIAASQRGVVQAIATPESGVSI